MVRFVVDWPLLPAASSAIATIWWVPMDRLARGTGSVQEPSLAFLVTVPCARLPSTRKCTDATPTSSLAVALRTTSSPDTVVVTDTVGAWVSAGGLAPPSLPPPHAARIRGTEARATLQREETVMELLG